MAEGSYYCQPVLSQGPPLLPSQSTWVEPFYSENFPRFNALVVPSSRCAEEGLPPQSALPFFFVPITQIAFADNAGFTPPPTSPFLVPGCPYRYTEEPPLGPTCNPYPVNELRLSCALLLDVSRAAGQLLRIEWLYQRPGDTTPITISSTLFELGTGSNPAAFYVLRVRMHIV